MALCTTLGLATVRAGTAGAATGVAAAGVRAADSSYYGWVGSQVGSGSLLDGISCPTANICYSVGGLYANSYSLIEKTNNGAASWSAQTFAATASKGTFDAISCPDSTHCMATGGGNGGTAYVTTDGLHWSASTLPPNTGELDGVSCVSDATCFAVSGTGTGVQTSNFGGTWTRLVYKTSSATAVPISNFGIVFPSATVGWIFGHSTTCTSSRCEGYIQKTTNGGATWTFAATPADMDDITSMTCADTNSCLAVGGTYDQMISYATNDGGATWQTSDGPTGVSVSGGMSCPTTTECFVTGSENNIYSAKGQLEDSTAVVVGTGYGGQWEIEQVTGGLSYTNGIACTSATVCVAVGGTWENAAVALTTDAGYPPGAGYYLVASDGGIFSYGTAPFYGSTGGITLNKPVVGMAVDSSGHGYWMVASDGGIFAFGNARFYGSTGGITLDKPVVGMAIDPATGGYWMVASDGGIFAFNAPFFGSMGGKAISAPIVGMKAMADGSGYYLLAQDGTTYAFGSARYETCSGKVPISSPIAALALDRVSGGYWIVNSGGAVALCLNVPYHGDLAGVQLNRPIVGMAATPDGGGYWMVTSDGGIFAFNAPFFGSTGGIHLAKPVVGIATVPST